MQESIYELLNKVEIEPTEEGKINVLRQIRKQSVVDIVMGAFDKRIKWLLPQGPIQYKPSKEHDIEGGLYSELRRLYIYVQGGNNNLSQNRREALFIQMLETIDKDDAKLMIAVKDKKLPFKSITPQLIKAAWPDVNIDFIDPIADADESKAPSKRKRKVKETPNVENSKSV